MVDQMKNKGFSLEEIERSLERAEDMDVNFSSGRVFGSMCTAPHPLAVKTHCRFHESNLGNPGLYPGTAMLERELVSLIGDLVHLEGAGGHLLSGGTEANITAMYTAKRADPRKKKVLFPRSAHFSVIKAVNLLGMEPVPIELDDLFRMSLPDLKKKMDGDVSMVIGVAGTTELGAVDPLLSVGDIVQDDAYLHVDAAFGGLVLPFLEEMGKLPEHIEPWDFRVPAVDSLSVDPHKMGCSTIPAGCLVFREPERLKRHSVGSPYLTSSMAYTLAGTRDSGAVAAAFAVMSHLGKEGYSGIVNECMDNTRYLALRLEELDLRPVKEPVMNLLAVGHPEPGVVQNAMGERGYYLSRVSDPSALRFVVMPHVTKKAIDGMVPVLEDVLADMD